MERTTTVLPFTVPLDALDFDVLARCTTYRLTREQFVTLLCNDQDYHDCHYDIYLQLQRTPIDRLLMIDAKTIRVFGFNGDTATQHACLERALLKNDLVYTLTKTADNCYCYAIDRFTFDQLIATLSTNTCVIIRRLQNRIDHLRDLYVEYERAWERNVSLDRLPLMSLYERARELRRSKSRSVSPVSSGEDSGYNSSNSSSTVVAMDEEVLREKRRGEEIKALAVYQQEQLVSQLANRCIEPPLNLSKRNEIGLYRVDDMRAIRKLYRMAIRKYDVYNEELLTWPAWYIIRRQHSNYRTGERHLFLSAGGDFLVRQVSHYDDVSHSINAGIRMKQYFDRFQSSDYRCECKGNMIVLLRKNMSVEQHVRTIKNQDVETFVCEVFHKVVNSSPLRTLAKANIDVLANK